MLESKLLPRVFKFKLGGKDIPLDDPDPLQVMTPEQVRIHYSHTYPELTTAKVDPPVMGVDQITYTFGSIFGTKG